MSECEHYYRLTGAGSYHCSKCDDFHSPNNLIQKLSVEIGGNRNEIAKLEADKKDLQATLAEAMSLNSRMEKEIHKCDKIYSEAIARNKELEDAEKKAFWASAPWNDRVTNEQWEKYKSK